MWTWHLGTWFSGGLGSYRLMVGLDDSKVLSNLKDSAIIFSSLQNQDRPTLENMLWPPNHYGFLHLNNELPFSMICDKQGTGFVD